MSGLEGVSLMVVVMDRGLLGLLLCLVVMCVAGAVGASIRLVVFVFVFVFLFVFVFVFVFVSVFIFCILYLVFAALPCHHAAGAVGTKSDSCKFPDCIKS